MQETIEQANDIAQGSFRACVAAYFAAGTWDTPETSAYLEAEGDLAWEKAKAEFDAIQAKDHDYHDLTGEYQPRTCDDCAAYSEQRVYGEYGGESMARAMWGDR